MTILNEIILDDGSSIFTLDKYTNSIKITQNGDYFLIKDNENEYITASTSKLDALEIHIKYLENNSEENVRQRKIDTHCNFIRTETENHILANLDIPTQLGIALGRSNDKYTPEFKERAITFIDNCSLICNNTINNIKINNILEIDFNYSNNLPLF